MTNLFRRITGRAPRKPVPTTTAEFEDARRARQAKQRELERLYREFLDALRIEDDLAAFGRVMLPDRKDDDL